MNAVGIDVSKGKSTVTIRQPGDVVIMPPCDIQHTQSAINDLIELIRGLDGETKVCMEHTGKYYEPVATWLSDANLRNHKFVKCQCLLIKRISAYSNVCIYSHIGTDIKERKVSACES